MESDSLIKTLKNIEDSSINLNIAEFHFAQEDEGELEAPKREKGDF